MSELFYYMREVLQVIWLAGLTVITIWLIKKTEKDYGNKDKQGF